MQKISSIYARTKSGIATVNILIRYPSSVLMPKTSVGQHDLFVKQVDCVHNGISVFNAQLGPGVSKDLFLVFRFNGAKKGDAIIVKWTNSNGETNLEEGVIG